MRRVPSASSSRRAGMAGRSILALRTVEEIAQAIPTGEERHEPRLTRIEGHGSEGLPVEGGRHILLTENLPRRLIAEIGHQRDTIAVAADREIGTVANAEMSDLVDRHGHSPA